jgi:hypothetical protein
MVGTILGAGSLRGHVGNRRAPMTRSAIDSMTRGDFPFDRHGLNLRPIFARPLVRAEVGVPLNDRRPGGTAVGRLRGSMSACRSRTNAEDRLPVDPLGVVEGGDETSPMFVRSRPSRTRWTISLSWARSDTTTKSTARPSIEHQIDAADVFQRVVVEVEAQICHAGCRTAVP